MATLRLRETGRHITRACQSAPRGCVMVMDREEKKTITVDFSDILGTATISSVVYDTHGITAENTSNTTTAATLRLSGERNGHVDVEATDSAGNVHIGRIAVNASYARRDYRRVC